MESSYSKIAPSKTSETIQSDISVRLNQSQHILAQMDNNNTLGHSRSTCGHEEENTIPSQKIKRPKIMARII